jgi:DNA-binding transcriptional MerR regulator
LADYQYTSQQAAAITGLSQRQLQYWRKTRLLTPMHATSGGHARYSFTDLIALKAAKRLIDADIPVQRIRKCIQSLAGFLPTIERPLHELSLVVTGDVVLILHGRTAFDALTGQSWILPVAELARAAELIKGDEEVPEQGELFREDFREERIA